MANLRSTEKRLVKDPEKADIYEADIQKLLDSGYVVKLDQDAADRTPESWFIPHHLVHHNGKDRLVFNCSYTYQGLALKQQLLPGPTLCPPLLGVLLHFRQHAVSIRAMFHQVRLLPEDQPLLRFIWRKMRRDEPPDIYQWQVLPFGTTCSPIVPHLLFKSMCVTSRRVMKTSCSPWSSVFMSIIVFRAL